MRIFDLIPTTYRLAAVGALMVTLAAGSAALAWTGQGWRYGQQLERQARLHADTLGELSRAAAAQQRKEHDKRLALEQRLRNKDEIHYKELTDEQTKQARLRDRLATSDLRLSVLIDSTDSVKGCDVSSTPGGVGMVHATYRAQLNAAHAQRILTITGDGDQGLIALRACQTYIRTLSAP